MGLDMTITKLIKSSVNERGNFVYEYEKIADLRNTWQFMDNLNSSIEFALGSNTTVEFSGKQIWEELENIDDKIEYDIVKEILENSKIENSDEEFYNISAWW